MTTNDAQSRAEALVAAVERETSTSSDAREAIVKAVAEEMQTASAAADVTDARLAKVETQARVLSEAVIALSHPSDTEGPAIQAVEDEM